MDDIYKMKLHEIKNIIIDGETLQIIRVPGGWIYRIYYYVTGARAMNDTFVPYHSPGEFK